MVFYNLDAITGATPEETAIIDARRRAGHRSIAAVAVPVAARLFICAVASPHPGDDKQVQPLLPLFIEAAHQFHTIEAKNYQSLVSAREQEVLSWVAQGKTAEEIAIILGISASTVNFHLKSLKEKSKTSTLHQLVAFGFLFNLIS
jgi:DNA-binding CsgD family transcriptional regulator